MPDEVRAGNDTRAAVADALRYVRDPRSVELLLPLLDDVGFLYTSERDVLVRDSAARSLKALSGERGPGTDRAAWTAWWEKAGKTLDDLGAVVVSLGPGSFTGVRIGLTHAKMLSWSRHIPLIGVSALEGVAARQTEAMGKKPVCALLPARKGEVFAGVYNVSMNDGLPRVETDWTLKEQCPSRAEKSAVQLSDIQLQTAKSAY